jgi:hypothetical protein
MNLFQILDWLIFSAAMLFPAFIPLFYAVFAEKWDIKWNLCRRVSAE